jgi:molybdopterin converting factor small subunit
MINITLLYAIILFTAVILLYLLCCRCVIFNSYIESTERNLQAIRETIEQNREEQLDIEIRRQAIMVQQLREKYELKYDEIMEEDEDHIVIINPNGYQISLGKKITDS